jgi:hypothetical protein
MDHLYGRSGCFITALIAVTMVWMLVCFAMAGPVVVVVWCWRRLGLNRSAQTIPRHLDDPSLLAS